MKRINSVRKCYSQIICKGKKYCQIFGWSLELSVIGIINSEQTYGISFTFIA